MSKHIDLANEAFDIITRISERQLLFYIAYNITIEDYTRLESRVERLKDIRDNEK